jgi:hypothetical protein
MSEIQLRKKLVHGGMTYAMDIAAGVVNVSYAIIGLLKEHTSFYTTV